MNHVNTASWATRDGLNDHLLALSIEALSFVAPDKIDNQSRQWLSGVPWVAHEGHWTVARSLAVELALITPSMQGTTAFDRLARAKKSRAPGEVAAILLLRRSVPRLARLNGDRFEDLATGETRILAPSPPSEASGDGEAFGRFALMADGRIIATGMLLRLDPETLALARGFARPGKMGPGGESTGRALSNPIRCAEVLYRTIVRRGTSDRPAPEPRLPFEPDSNPLDALAAEWAALEGEPGPEEVARARDLIGVQPLLNALISVSIARDGGAKRLADSYRRIAAALIEFMVVREAYGSARFNIDRAAAELDATIARGHCGPETRVLFNDLRQRARLALGKMPGASDDLDKLVQRIRALRAKTVDQGCTEHEALAAAGKVAELLDRHGLSLSELDLRKQSCEGIGVDTGRKRRGPIDDCVAMIAAFFDCRVWGEMGEGETLRWIFFGLPADVQAALYLNDLIALAFATETAAFQTARFYRSLASGPRRSATNSFQVGLAHGIIDKLDTLREARAAASAGTTGRDLVPVKQSIIEQEMERLGLSLRRLSTNRRNLISDAFSAGKQAGEKFEYRQGIKAA
jgi:hypothetical protein